MLPPHGLSRDRPRRHLVTRVCVACLVTLLIAAPPAWAQVEILPQPWVGGTGIARGTITPSTNDGAALGTAALSWSDLFLASGAVINFSNGDVTLTHSTDRLTLNDNLTMSGTGPYAIGGAIDTRYQIYQRGTFTPVGNSLGAAWTNETTLNVEEGDDGYGMYWNPRFVEADSGTHGLLATSRIEVASVTAGGATVTNTASSYIAGEMSATVTGANYALWSDSGVNRFDGPVITGSRSVDLDGVTTFAATSSYIVLTCTGAETLNTITMTGVATGTILDIEHGDTDCTIADDDDVTAANALDLTGTATNDVGAVNKIITVRRHSGGYWVQLSESDN